MDGPVFETEAEFAGDPVSLCALDQTTRREKFVFQIAKHKKAVKAPLEMTHRHLIRY
jgi:hypothetical protein